MHRWRSCRPARLLRGDEEDSDKDLKDDHPLRPSEPERVSRHEVNAALKREFSGLTRADRDRSTSFPLPHIRRDVDAVCLQLMMDSGDAAVETHLEYSYKSQRDSLCCLRYILKNKGASRGRE